MYIIRRRTITDDDVSRARGWRRHVLIGAAMVLAVIGGEIVLRSSVPGSGLTPSARTLTPGVASAWATLRAALRTAVACRAKESLDSRDAMKVSQSCETLLRSGAISMTTGRHLVRTITVRLSCDDPTKSMLELRKEFQALQALRLEGKLTPDRVSAGRDHVARLMLLFDAASSEAKLIDPPGETLQIEPVPQAVRNVADTLLDLLVTEDPPSDYGPPELRGPVKSVEDAIAVVRLLWREPKEYPVVNKHDEAIDYLVGRSRLDPESAEILKEVFTMVCPLPDFIEDQAPVGTCYIPATPSTVQDAQDLAKRNIPRIAATLAELKETGKLSSDVSEKAGRLIARALIVVSLPDESDDSSAHDTAFSYYCWEPIVMPEKYKKAGTALSELLASSSDD